MLLPRWPRGTRASILLGLGLGLALALGQIGSISGGSGSARAARFAPARPTPSRADRARTAHPPIHVRRSATFAPTGYSPAQTRHAYTLDQLTAGGNGQIVAIVDAYDDPTAASDLQTFVSTFGLPTMHGLPNTGSCSVSAGPHPCFQKLYAQGFRPRSNGGWALEASLDVQWTHAVASTADILLVESQDNTFQNLFGAVDAAVSRGASVVSMSWGGGEFASESAFDAHFDHTGVSFTASAGDAGTGALYPAASPLVISVGGTTLPLDGAGNLTGPEAAWNGSGGGISDYEPEPAYQSAFPIPNTSGRRGVPDVAYDADPSTGFSVYDSTPYAGQIGWFQVGGTSAGAPQWAGLIALADEVGGARLSSNNLTSSPQYGAAAGSLFAADYRDVTMGSNGGCGAVCTAGAGYDFVT
ncbi:MAG: S53 family peptidase, partial [Chloroflexota bacterium]|nr:S53 family peptidase [Chloroflexota bacterium]